MVVLRVPEHPEGGSDELRNEQDNSHHDVPPVDVLIQQQVEHLGVGGHSQEEDEDSDGDESALGWEAAQAGEASGLDVGAVASAAAALAGVPLVFLLLFLFIVFKQVLVFIGSW